VSDGAAVICPVSEANFGQVLRFTTDWVSADEAGARQHFADHAEGGGSSLVAMLADRAVGIVTIRWQSNYAGFRDADIPLVHQISVAGPFRRKGIAAALMDAAEQLARDRGAATIGITVGLFDEYGPAQRMFALRGYVPDGRGACLGQDPVSKGARVIIGHELIIWLTKDLSR
jgi:GNAT superfamily N-acetyltransferase